MEKRSNLFVDGLCDLGDIYSSIHEPIPDRLNTLSRGREKVDDLASAHSLAIVGRFGIRSVHQQLVTLVEVGLPQPNSHGENCGLLDL